MIGLMTDLMVKWVGSIGRRVVAELLVGLGFRVWIVIHLGRRMVVSRLILLNSGHLDVLRLLEFLLDAIAAAMTMALRLALA